MQNRFAPDNGDRKGGSFQRPDFEEGGNPVLGRRGIHILTLLISPAKIIPVAYKENQEDMSL